VREFTVVEDLDCRPNMMMMMMMMMMMIMTTTMMTVKEIKERK
jgi:hypothetical protein